jgi:predicted membrane channel-forming protein YqfA (hemolysin III family)
MLVEPTSGGPIGLTNLTTGLHGLKWTYNIIIPTTTVFGILGNLLTLFVLLTNDKKKFGAFMFVYMKGLAIIDIIQLIFTQQVRPFQIDNDPFFWIVKI